MQGNVACFLHSLKYEETEIGMIEFDGKSNDLISMRALNGPTDRDQLIAAIPEKTGSGTCIGCGIRSALEVILLS